MSLRRYLPSLSLAALLCGSPALAVENVPDAGNDADASARSAVEIMIDESAQPAVPTEGFEFAAVDFCYLGSIVDSDTGETMDVLGLCSDDAIGGNLDLA
jgi:hypothetical protein